MITFFRKIRRKLADDNQFIKYSRYAVGEILLVMVGILLALQVNNWNEERKKQILKSVYKRALIEDLQKDIKQLSKDIDSTVWHLENCKAIGEKITINKLDVDSIIIIYREELYASFFIGGDFRRYEFSYNEEPVYFVTRGNWKIFNENEIFDLLKRTITSQNDFWNDPRKGMFSVSLLPTFEPWTASSKANSIGGSGFSNSFISFASNNQGTTLKNMTWLYNHELLHKWIGRTILNENEVEQYWFSEGFTEYYSYKLMLKNDDFMVQEFIDRINTNIIIPHFKDPVNTIPNSELTFQKYWSNYGDYGQLPYRRGFLYAFLIDIRIKTQSNFTKSLDDVMHELLKKALSDEKMRLNEDLFRQFVSKYTNESSLKDFEEFIIKGSLIDFTEELLSGLIIETENEIPLVKIKPNTSIDQLGRKLKL